MEFFNGDYLLLTKTIVSPLGCMGGSPYESPCGLNLLQCASVASMPGASSSCTSLFIIRSVHTLDAVALGRAAGYRLLPVGFCCCGFFGGTGVLVRCPDPPILPWSWIHVHLSITFFFFSFSTLNCTHRSNCTLYTSTLLLQC